MGTANKDKKCGRCGKEIHSPETAVPYRNGTLAHAECAPPRGTRQRWSDANRRFLKASAREPTWTLLLALHVPRDGVSEPPFLLVEEEPYRVSVNGSSPVFIGDPYWSAVQDLEELGFIVPKSVGTYELTDTGREVAEIGPK